MGYSVLSGMTHTHTRRVAVGLSALIIEWIRFWMDSEEEEEEESLFLLLASVTLSSLFSDRLVGSSDVSVSLLVALTRDCFLFFPAGFWKVSLLAPQLLTHSCCWI